MADAKYIYVAESGGRYGPATVEELNRWAADGRVGPLSLIENVETGREVMARDIPGFGVLVVDVASAVTPIKNPLPKAILSTTCFGFPPAGLVAVFYAAQVRGLERSGQRARAEEYADRANWWSSWSIWLGVLFSVLLVVGVVVQAMRGGGLGLLQN